MSSSYPLTFRPVSAGPLPPLNFDEIHPQIPEHFKTSPPATPNTFSGPLATHHTGPFRLLDLPPEIRAKIYKIICISPTPVSLSSTPIFRGWISLFTPPLPGPNPYSFPGALHLVSHQIYDETRPLYFGLNTFWFPLSRHTSELAHFLSPSFLDSRRQIRRLKIVAQRWGRKDHFKDEVAPIIEDMIINGSLRKFEVVVTEYFAAALETKRSERENGIWLVLKGLCNDPYLESVSLKTVGFVDLAERIAAEKDVSYLLKKA